MIKNGGALYRDDYVVDESSGEIVLLKIGAGLKKLYLEPTARGLAAPGRGSLPEGYRFPEPTVWLAVEKDYVLWGSLRLPRMYWGSSLSCGFV